MRFLLPLSIFDSTDELMPFGFIFKKSTGHLDNNGDDLAEAYGEEGGGVKITECFGEVALGRDAN